MPRSRSLSVLAGVVVLTASSLAAGPDNGLGLPTLEEVTDRLVQADRWRTASLQRYISLRRYRAENKRFHKRAEMVVRVKYTFPGKKEFEVISTSGSGIVQRLVLRRLIETEKKTSEDEEAREHTRITPENYQFQWLGADVIDARPCYRLAVEPRRKTPLLFRGVIWVDAEDSAVVRIEGSPAKSPSFWTRKIRFEQRYGKVGPFWLPLSNESRSEVRIFGDSETSIEYCEYEINQAPVETTTGSEAGRLP